MRYLVLIIFFLFVVSCSIGKELSSLETEPEILKIIYSSNLDGELEPCGCTIEGDLGGIQRRVTVIDQYREQSPELILISGGGLLDTYFGEAHIKNNYILKGLGLLSYDAIGVQWRDLAFGTQLLGNSNLPFVSSNYPTDNFVRSKLIVRNNIEVNFFSLLDPTMYPLMHDKEKFDDFTSSLTKQLKAAKKKQQITLLTTTAPETWLVEHVGLSYVDILVKPLKREEYKEPTFIGGTIVLHPGARGMRLGSAVVSIKKNEVDVIKHEILELSAKIPEPSRMSDWYKRYNEDVKKNFERVTLLDSQAEAEGQFYLGQGTCKTCHSAIADKLASTKHSHAYASLQRVDKAFDPECVECHVVGFNKPGGFISSAHTPHLADVQCENCHGNAAEKSSQLHSSNPFENKQGLVKHSPQEVCQQCHNHNHSPSFEFKEYWPKIMHPK